jgi:hypothetical protein
LRGCEGGAFAGLPGAHHALQRGKQAGDEGQDQRVQHGAQATLRRLRVGLDGAAQAGDMLGQGGRMH